MSRKVQCIKLGREADGLGKPPIPGAVGQKIFEQVSAEAWQMWLGNQTMIINENRLNLSDADSRKYLQDQMKVYLFGEA